MRNLKELKLNANKYKWSMLSNSWFETVPNFLSDFRTVSRVQTTKLAFLTIKNGKTCESWTDFPKASLLDINLLPHGDIILTFKGETEKHCTLVYLLKPIEG